MKRSLLPILVVTAFFALATRSEGADGTWTFAGNGSWDLATNWSGSTIASGVNSTATFSYGLPNTTNSIISVDTARTIGNLTFTGTAGAGTHNITLNGPEALTLSTGTATAPAITANMGSRTVTINTVLKGSEGLNLSATSSLILGGANTYSGITTFASGTVSISNNSALGATGTGNETTVTGSATLVLTNGIKVTGESVTLSGATNPSGSLLASGSAEWAGGVLINSSNTRVGTNDASSQLTISGVIANGTNSNLFVSGLGTTVFSGANTYTGNTQIYRGTLKLDGGNNRLPTSTAVTMGGTTDASTFDLNGRNQQVASITDGTSTGNRTITNTSGTASALTLNGSTTASFAGTGNTTITGNLSLIKDGSYTQTLAKVNSYTGNTTINSGTLILSDNSTMTFFIKGNGVNNGISGAGGITLDGDFIFDLSGASLANANSWNIISVGTLSETFGTTFTVQGFTKTGNVWINDTNNNVRFYETTGILSVVPEPSTAALLLLGGASAFCIALRRRMA